MAAHQDPEATPDDGLLDALLEGSDEGGDGQALEIEDDDVGGVLEGLLDDDDGDDEDVLGALLEDADDDVAPEQKAAPESPRKTRFEDLGGPIQALLKQVCGEDGSLSDDDAQTFSHVPVKLLAMAWERLGQGGDPQTVLDWLRKQGHKAEKEKEKPRDAPKPAEAPAAAADDDGDVLAGLLEGGDDEDGGDVLDGLLADDQDDGEDDGDAGMMDDLLAAEMGDEEQAAEPAPEEHDASEEPIEIIEEPAEPIYEPDASTPPSKPRKSLPLPPESPSKPVWDGVLPLQEVPNPRWLRASFAAVKHMPHLHQVVSGDHQRLWIIDHFSGTFTEYDRSGKRKRQHPASKLLQVERHYDNPAHLRLLFFGAGKSYDIILQSGMHRERFFEVANAVRPAIRTVAPALLKRGRPQPGYVRIDATGANKGKTRTANPVRPGEMIEVSLEGEGKISCSTREDDVLTLWCGTWNQGGARPKAQDLLKWLPSGEKKHDLYCIVAQGCTWQSHHGEWCRALHAQVGRTQFLVLASHQVGPLCVVVLSRKRLLLSITNVEGTGVDFGGDRVAVGIGMRVNNTAMAFVACHLPKLGKQAPIRIKSTVEAHGLVSATELNGVRGRVIGKDPTGERWYVEFNDDCETDGAGKQKRSLHPKNLRVEEATRLPIDLTRVLAQLRLGAKTADTCSQFHHVFLLGHFNTHTDISAKRVMQLVRGRNFLQPATDRHGRDSGRNVITDSDNLYAARRRGVLFGFEEAPVRFPPTGRYASKQLDALCEPGYTDRVLFRNLPGTGLRCNGYAATASMSTSAYLPVAASFAVRCLRPHLSCFDPSPPLAFELLSFDVSPQLRAVPKKVEIALWSPLLADGESRGKRVDVADPKQPVSFEGKLPPPLKLVNSMRGYIARQFVVVLLRSAEGDLHPADAFQSAASVFFAGESHAAALARPGEELAGVGSLLRFGRSVGKWKMRYRFVPCS